MHIKYFNQQCQLLIILMVNSCCKEYVRSHPGHKIIQAWAGATFGLCFIFLPETASICFYFLPKSSTMGVAINIEE